MPEQVALDDAVNHESDGVSLAMARDRFHPVAVGERDLGAGREHQQLRRQVACRRESDAPMTFEARFTNGACNTLHRALDR